MKTKTAQAISIVIPTINRYEDLENTLSDLNKQVGVDFEIIVVDQTDNAQRVEGANVRYVHVQEKSASHARNVGLAEAKNNIVLFLDDDVRIMSQAFLFEHSKHYDEGQVSGVAGLVCGINGKSQEQLMMLRENKRLGCDYFPENAEIECRVSGGMSGNLSVRRDWAIEIGGMDERFERGAYREETDFCLRYTKKFGKFIFNPKAELIHIGNPEGGSHSWENQIVQGAHHAFGGWYLMFRHLQLSLWPRYSYHMLRRFILHRKLARNIHYLPKAVTVFLASFIKAVYFSCQRPKLMSKG